ncbi:hypothetical protein AVEN_55310-1 [Araneus ventricosus]|uniref:Uncharacterized protein n=1 Tax=Araneus ventricosus TaxID=182803 RepID=A0A4Y2D8P2_ARAVE|nr:hypothetical protein AVEN_55310-1 [Araneus ventricosus]
MPRVGGREKSPFLIYGLLKRFYEHRHFPSSPTQSKSRSHLTSLSRRRVPGRSASKPRCQDDFYRANLVKNRSYTGMDETNSVALARVNMPGL